MNVLPDQANQPHQARRTADAWFEAAYRDHHHAVTAAARLLCGPDHAADVAHDVFDALWRHREVFDPERGSLRAFLTALARHKAIDVLRHETALKAREDRIDTWQPPLRTEIDDNLLCDEAASRVRAALDALPPAEREAITTAFYNGCSYRQTAARLGEPEGTIKSRIRTGLHRLRPHLADLCDPLGGQTCPPKLD